MPEQKWSTLRATGLCHLVVVEAEHQAATSAESRALDLKDLLELACRTGDYAIDVANGQTCIAFTSFSDMECVTGALRGVRAVRQLETRWSSQWDGIYDRNATMRLRSDLRWQRRAGMSRRRPAPRSAESPGPAQDPS
jgi:hypothetical protein